MLDRAATPRRFRRLACTVVAATLLAAACDDQAASPASTSPELGDPEQPAMETLEMDDMCPIQDQVDALDEMGYPSTCWRLNVFEDPADASAGMLALTVLRVAATGESPADDPMVYLEGGPGGDPFAFLQFSFEDFFAEFVEERDLIIFGQRGSGASSPDLRCPNVDVVSNDLADDGASDVVVDHALLAAMEECRSRLVDEGADLTKYNSLTSSADLESFRTLAGIDRWNLYGVSYGTRLAQTAMREYPSGIRSVVLDSTVPVGSDPTFSVPETFKRSVDLVVRTCREQLDCVIPHPDLRSEIDALYASLEESPLEAAPRNLVTQEVVPVLVDGDVFIATMFEMLYARESLQSIPALIDQLEAGQLHGFESFAGLSLAQRDAFSLGMFLSVSCNEEAAFVSEEDLASSRTGTPMFDRIDRFAGTSGEQVFGVCDLWSAGQAPPIENEAVVVDVPTLVLAGEFDPITPPSFGRAVADMLPSSFFVEFPGLAHGVLADECAKAVSIAFLSDPMVNPNASCARSLPEPTLVFKPTTNIPLESFKAESGQGGGTISSVAPAGWESVVPGSFQRQNHLLDPGAINFLAFAGDDIEGLVTLLETNIEIDLVEGGSVSDAADREWLRFVTSTSPAPVDVFVRSEGGFLNLVILQSEEADRGILVDEVALPALDSYQHG